MSASCDGCGKVYNLSHALDCCRGDLVTKHHNEIRDALGDLAALGYRKVVCERVVCGGNEFPLF